MKKRNLATAMAAAVAVTGVVPAMASANEVVANNVKTIDVAKAEGKKVTTGKTYTEVYNTNFTDTTKDDTIKNGFEVLATTNGTIGDTTDKCTAEITVAVKDSTLTKKEITDAKKDLEDTVLFIEQQLKLTYKNSKGEVKNVYSLKDDEGIVDILGNTSRTIKLEVAEDAEGKGYTNYEFKFVNLKVEDKIQKPNAFGNLEINLINKKALKPITFEREVARLNKVAYELKLAGDKIKVTTNEANNGNDLVLTVLLNDEEKTELGTITLVDYKIFKSINHEGFVDLSEIKDLNELDLPELSWAKDAIVNALVEGKLTGDERGFRAKDSVTRAEFAKMLVELSGLSVKEDAEAEFSDINEADWFYGYVATLADMGIVSGDGNGTFRPQDAITRQEVAVMIASMKTVAVNGKHSKVDGFDAATGTAIDTKTMFKDDASIALWADAAVKYLEDTNISTGDENKNFNPENNITRAESVVMINRAATVNFTATNEVK